MEDAHGVDGLEGFEGLSDQDDGLVERETSSLAQRPIDGGARRQLHAVVEAVAVLAEVVDPDDVRVRQLRECAGFAVEPPAFLDSRRADDEDHLEGDLAFQAELKGAIHRAGTAGAYELQDAVLVEGASGLEHGRMGARVTVKRRSAAGQLSTGPVAPRSPLRP
jgi:hypothetical protein